jgi:2-phospho-L-lactate/phosphoenolpyruvate guanylyltransferase
MADIAAFTWSVVIPVKVLAQAKSRLGLLGAERRAGLALAMAADTVTAVLECPEVARVIVITDDEVAGAALAKLGALVIPDEPSAGLNPALRHGAAHVRAHWPASGVAALSADLPALRPADLTAALTAAAGWPTAFVADAPGDGTTLYTARPGAAFAPAFGLASRARHAAGGAAELDLAGLDGLRRDVDTPADLRTAATLGLGPNTAPVAAGLLRCAPRGR